MQKIILVLIAALFASNACAAYPERPIRIIVPYGPGGSDAQIRLVIPGMQKILGQPFVVEDRPGGGSVVGTDTVAKSAPDGYTLLMMSNTHTVNESLIPNKPYSLLKDLVPVAPLARALAVVEGVVGITVLGMLIASWTKKIMCR